MRISYFLKAFQSSLPSDTDTLKKAIKIRLLQEFVKEEDAPINKSFALLSMFPNE